jgi:hypothetical protein
MEEAQVKKKRVRKKTCEIDSLEKLKSDTRTSEPKVEDSEKVTKPKATRVTKPKVEKEKVEKVEKAPKKTIKKESQNDKEDVNQSQISFGKFNITVKKKETMTAEELRSYYDNKFKIEDSEKTAKLMVQEDDTDAVFEPIMEDDTYVPKKSDSKPDKPRTKIERTNVHRVLSKFIDGTKEEWPEKTDIYCWWCCHSFDNSPIPCPVEYDEIRDRYKVNGVFCSWSCAAAYSIKEYSSLALIYQLKNELSGYSENIVVAPPRYCLKNFGGYMTIKDYRALDKTKTLLISTEGLSYINMEIAEMKN